LSQNVVHSDSDLILHNSSVLIDKEPTNPFPNKRCSKACICGNKSSQTKNMRSYFLFDCSYYLM
ncbi:hypothetical protein EWU37_10955, partial [Enterococcus faecium]